jgi:hypothetical protein
MFPKFVETAIGDLKKWSPWTYIFETILTIFISAVVKRALDLSLGEAIWFASLLFCVIVSGMMAYQQRDKAMTLSDFWEIECAREMVRESQAVGLAMELFRALVENCPEADEPEFEVNFKRWRKMAREFIRGTLSKQVLEDFDKQSRLVGNDPKPAKMFLIGLVNNLTRYDLRSRLNRDAFPERKLVTPPVSTS